MKLTEENQDSMDCRPLGRETGIVLPPEMEAKFAARVEKAKTRMAARLAKLSQLEAEL